MATIRSDEPTGGSPTVRPGEVAAPASGRSIPPPAAVAVLLVLLLGAILLRPGGRSLSDDTEHVQRTTVLPFLSPGQSITQPFTARADGLSQVMIRFAVGDGATGCRVRVRVVDAGHVVRGRDAACADLRQAEIWTLSFPPIAHSDGKDFEAQVTLIGASSAPMSVWGGPSLGTLPVANLDGTDLPVSVELHTAYGNDRFAVQQLGRALDRIEGYGPLWHQPVFVVALALLAIACLVAVAGTPRRFGLLLVVAFAIVKGVLWSTVLPPMEGPDEHAHFAYAQFMAEQHRIPRRDDDQLGIHRAYSEELERGIQDVYHLTSQWPGNRPDFSDRARARADELLAGAPTDAGGAGAAAGYSPYYYAPAAALYLLAPADLDMQLGAMRLWSVALGAMAAWLAVLIGRRLFPGSEVAALALGIAAAAQPMLSQQMAIVNNDGLVIVAGFACLLIALDLAAPAAHRRLLLLGGLAAGLALATKPFGITWAPVLALAWFIGRRRTAPSERRSWLGDGVRAGVGLALTYGAWVALSVVLDLPASAVQTFNPDPGSKSLLHFLHLHAQDAFKPLRDRWIDQFWGDFGGLTLPLPHWVQSLLTAVAVLTMVALVAWVATTAVRLARTRLRGIDDSELTSMVHIGLCAFAVLLTLSVLHAADFLQFHRNGRLELLQGRYALMVLPAALALPALLAGRFAPRLRTVMVMTTIAGATVALNVLGLTLIVERYYL